MQSMEISFRINIKTKQKIIREKWYFILINITAFGGKNNFDQHRFIYVK